MPSTRLATYSTPNIGRTIIRGTNHSTVSSSPNRPNSPACRPPPQTSSESMLNTIESTGEEKSVSRKEEKRRSESLSTHSNVDPLERKSVVVRRFAANWVADFKEKKRVSSAYSLWLI